MYQPWWVSGGRVAAAAGHANRKHEGYARFRHWDMVRYRRRDGSVHWGTVRSFVPARRVVKCRFSFDEHYGVYVSRRRLGSEGRLQLVWRSGAVVYLPQIEEKGGGSSTGR